MHKSIYEVKFICKYCADSLRDNKTSVCRISDYQGNIVDVGQFKPCQICYFQYDHAATHEIQTVEYANA